MDTGLARLLLTLTAVTAIAFGSLTARADEADDIADALQTAVALSAATGGANLVSQALQDPDAAETFEALLDAAGIDDEE